MMPNDRQTRFKQLYDEYLARFKEDPPVGALRVETAIAAIEGALAQNSPLPRETAAARDGSHG